MVTAQKDPKNVDHRAERKKKQKEAAHTKVSKLKQFLMHLQSAACRELTSRLQVKPFTLTLTESLFASSSSSILLPSFSHLCAVKQLFGALCYSSISRFFVAVKPT